MSERAVPSTHALDSAVARALPAHDPTTGVIALQTMRLGRLIERRLQELLAPSGLERSELSVLSLLLLVDDDAWVSPTELARSVVQTTSGMTKTLRRLEGRGLIVRARDERDGRGVVARLTPAGQRTAARPRGSAHRRVRRRARRDRRRRPQRAERDAPAPAPPARAVGRRRADVMEPATGSARQPGVALAWSAATLASPSGAGGARRYDPDVSVFAATEADDERSWADLAALAGHHGVVVLIGPVPLVAARRLVRATAGRRTPDGARGRTARRPSGQRRRSAGSWCSSARPMPAPPSNSSP